MLDVQGSGAPALWGKTEASEIVQPGEERASVGQSSILIAVLYKGARLFIVMSGWDASSLSKHKGDLDWIQEIVFWAGVVQPPSLKVFKNKWAKALSNMMWSFSWPCFEQEIELDELLRSSCTILWLYKRNHGYFILQQYPSIFQLRSTSDLGIWP